MARTILSSAVRLLLTLGAGAVAHAQSPAFMPAFDDVLAPGGRTIAGGPSPSGACGVRRDAEGVVRFVAAGTHVPAEREEKSPDWPEASGAGAGEWRSAIGRPGIAGASVAAILVRGDTVLVGGQFTRAGDAKVSGIAMWSRSAKRWSSFPGEFDGEVRSIVMYGNEIVAGGNFSRVDGVAVFGIARWNGTRWDSVGGGFSRAVDELIVADGALYAAGSFNYAGDNIAHGIATWTGSEWIQVGDGLTGSVDALAYGGGALYAGGEFTLDGGASFNVARFDGTRWRPLGQGISAQVVSLAWHDGALFAGGGFYYADNLPLYGIARWTGTSWEAAGGDRNVGDFLGLQSDGTNLYVVGSFTYLDATRVDGVARWTGATWEPVGAIPGRVTSVAIAGDEIFAGGSFTTADGIAVDNIAHYDGTAWEPMGNGLRDGLYGPRVVAIASIGDEVYVGGVFTRAGGVPASNIAAWNRRTGTWSQLGEGANARINSLCVRDGRLLAAGEFTSIGGITANRVAEWDPETGTWSRLGTGIRPYVLSIDLVADALYASSYSLMSWNGASWEWDPDGPDNWVYAVADLDGALVATGIFEACGDQPTASIALHDASGWHPLGGGLEGYGLSLSAYGGELVVGGGFRTVDDPTIENIARWNGTRWAQIDNGIDGDVWSLARMGDDLYAGGFFGSAGAAFTSNVARLSGGRWSALGDGTDWVVYAVHAVERELYVGGYFAVAGRDSAANVALWSAGPAAVATEVSDNALAVAPNPASDMLTMRLRLPNGGRYALELIDVLGDRVRRVAGEASPGEQRLSMDCAGLGAGAYVLRCRTDQGVTSRSIVIGR